MYDREWLCEKLIQISEVLEKVVRRFKGIHEAENFLICERELDMHAPIYWKRAF